MKTLNMLYDKPLINNSIRAIKNFEIVTVFTKNQVTQITSQISCPCDIEETKDGYFIRLSDDICFQELKKRKAQKQIKHYAKQRIKILQQMFGIKITPVIEKEMLSQQSENSINRLFNSIYDELIY